MTLPDKPEQTTSPAVHDAQVKLTAGYPNSAASGFCAAGVIAPSWPWPSASPDRVAPPPR